MAEPTVRPIPMKAAIIELVISFSCSSTTLEIVKDEISLMQISTLILRRKEKFKSCRSIMSCKQLKNQLTLVHRSS